MGIADQLRSLRAARIVPSEFIDEEPLELPIEPLLLLLLEGIVEDEDEDDGELMLPLDDDGVPVVLLDEDDEPMPVVPVVLLPVLLDGEVVEGDVVEDGDMVDEDGDVVVDGDMVDDDGDVVVDEGADADDDGEVDWATATPPPIIRHAAAIAVDFFIIELM